MQLDWTKQTASDRLTRFGQERELAIAKRMAAEGRQTAIESTRRYVRAVCSASFVRGATTKLARRFES